MHRNILNFVVDVVTLLTMLAMILTGLLIKFTLPPRRATGPHRTLWGWDRHDWGDFHFWTAVALGALLLVHVALHWKWVCATVADIVKRGRDKTPVMPGRIRNLYGVGFLAVIAAIIGGFLWLAAAGVETSGGQHDRGSGRGRAAAISGGGSEPLEAVETARSDRANSLRRRGSSELHIRGSTTLGEIARMTGISLTRLRTALGLPEDVSPDENLGRLGRAYGFEIPDVRKAVQRLQASDGAPSTNQGGTD